MASLRDRLQRGTNLTLVASRSTTRNDLLNGNTDLANCCGNLLSHA